MEAILGFGACMCVKRMEMGTHCSLTDRKLWLDPGSGRMTLGLDDTDPASRAGFSSGKERGFGACHAAR